jgi:hypothetical protein
LRIRKKEQMQVQHKAAVHVQPHHQAAAVEHGLGDWAGLLLVIVLIVGVPAFAVLFWFRAFRWFFRATR